MLSTFYNTGRWTKSKNPVILLVVHHRQNVLEYTVQVVYVEQINIDEEQGGVSGMPTS
jgi:hypothetical protein